MVVDPKVGEVGRSVEAGEELLHPRHPPKSWFRFCQPQPGEGTYGLGGVLGTKFETLCPKQRGVDREKLGQRGQQEEQESVRNGRGVQDPCPLWGLVLKG